MRKIHIAGFDWHWKFGDPVILRAPDNQYYRVSLGELTGLSNEAIEKGRWKRWFSLTPRDVADYIYRTFDKLYFEVEEV